jgi:hypothetical protein
MDINSLTPSYFEWVVEHMADLAIKLATAPRSVPAVGAGAGPVISAPPAGLGQTIITPGITK